MRRFGIVLLTAAGLPLATVAAHAQVQGHGNSCPVTHDQLETALKANVRAAGGPDNGGLPVNEWAAVVDRNGTVCAIAYSGKAVTDQWLGSRAIAIEKANTVNDFSLDSFAISTANLWAPSQPGNSLYSLPFSNPPVAQELYAGDISTYGTVNDPILGKKPGGVIVFAGGLPLYQKGKGLVGGLGASGNTSCADHNIAWRVREQLGFNAVPNGPSPDHNDEIIYDIGKDNKSKTGWGHPECGMSAPQVAQKIGSGIVLLPSSQSPGTQQQAPQHGSSGQGTQQQGSQQQAPQQGSPQQGSQQQQTPQQSSSQQGSQQQAPHQGSSPQAPQQQQAPQQSSSQQQSGSGGGHAQGKAAAQPGAITVRPVNSQVPQKTVSPQPVTSSTSHHTGQLPPLQPPSSGQSESTLPDWMTPKTQTPNPPGSGAGEQPPGQ